MTLGDDDWLRPIDLTVDSDAPEQIAFELGRRHALFLREAQRLVLAGLVPDAPALAVGIRAETGRYLQSHPWFAHPTLERTVAEVEGRALAALEAIVEGVSAATATTARTPPPRPIRRLALQPSATIVGNMAVRKRPAEHGVELSWDPVPSVREWTLRISVRPDPRQDYVEGEVLTVPADTRSLVVELDDRPRRIQLYGHARDGRIVRRATVSALTRGNSGAQWKRQATAS